MSECIYLFFIFEPVEIYPDFGSNHIIFTFLIIPGITDYRIKVARQHTVQYGRGVPLPSVRSPRMRVSLSQLDNFLSFITSPHIVQDLPFGQSHLQLSNGKILETPNTIRIMISQRIVDQYIVLH